MTRLAFMRSWALGGALVIAVAVRASGQGDEEVRSWLEPTEPTRILGPIHYVGTRGLAVYLITTPEGHVLLNAGMPKSASLIEASIRKLGFKPEDIKILLTGHAHIDHVGTHAHFKRLSGAQVAIMEEEVGLLESGGRTDFHYAHLESSHFDPVKVNRVLRDGDTVTLGGVAMTARLTPGHTKGCTTWTMDVVEGGKAVHVVFPDGTSVNPGYRLVRNPSYPGIADDYRRTFRVLEQLRPDVWLSPHTSMFDFAGKRARVAQEGFKAWVDPTGYRSFVVDKRKVFERRIEAEISGPGFDGTSRQLVRFVGKDGATLAPEDRSNYTAAFGADGRLSARVDCNRGAGAWKLGGLNQIHLGPLALTRSACPPHPLTDRLPRDWENLRSYAFKDGHLLLSLEGEGGTYEFEPTPGPAGEDRK